MLSREEKGNNCWQWKWCHCVDIQSHVQLKLMCNYKSSICSSSWASPVNYTLYFCAASAAGQSTKVINLLHRPNNPINCRVPIGGRVKVCVRGLNGQAHFERDIKYDFWKSNNMPVGYMRGQFLGRLKVKLWKGGRGRWGNGCSVTILITVPTKATFITEHTHTLAAKGKDTHSPPIEHILLRGPHLCQSPHPCSCQWSLTPLQIHERSLKRKHL